jgi:GT2 family glycosyltransferase
LEALGLGRLIARRDFVIGSVLLLRGEAVDEIGGLDERFFLYAEETDWQMRAARAGWRSLLVEGLSATHVGAGTGGDPTRRETHFHASHERLIRKHYGRRGWRVYRAAHVAGSAVRAILARGDQRARARYRLDLYLRGPVRAEERLPAQNLAAEVS